MANVQIQAVQQQMEENVTVNNVQATHVQLEAAVVIAPNRPAEQK